MDTEILSLSDYARTFPSQGGVEIGQWLEKYASEVPKGSAIVEVGCWLGAGTAHLALGAMYSGAPIHCYDRWTATEQEVAKAERFGVNLWEGQDTLPLVMKNLDRFDAEIHYHKGSIKELAWKGQPIGLYVDDATKIEPLWLHAMDVFGPHFVPRETYLILMDFRFYEKAGDKYAAQRDYMAEHSQSFQLIEDRLADTSAALFKYNG